jgi:L-fucose mutarotase
MLKGIPSILTPELLRIMMEMGHSDELILADGNYPRLGHPERVVRCDGHGIPELLDAIMRFFPLDTYVDHPVILMNVPSGTPEPPIWTEYRKIIARYEPNGAREEPIERFTFYKRAAGGYAVVTSGETAAYGNIILKTGVIRP